MCSFITQHNATDVASFEGACNWHADSRNVHQSCCPWIECSFLYHKPSPKAFHRIWQYIQPASQPQTTCNHTNTTSTSSIFTSKIVWDQPPGQLLQQSVCITKEFLHKLSETVSGKLICMLVVLIGVSTWLQFVIVTDFSGQMLTFDGVWHFGEVFSSRMNPSFHCTGQMADSVYGVVWVSGLLMSTLWIEWPMVAVGLWYGQAYVMDNEHRCILLMAFWMHRDTVTRSWGPLFCHSSTTITSCCSIIMHGPMLQGSVHNSWKLKTSQFLHGQHTHRTCHPLSMFGMLWIGVYDSVFQFLPISSNFAQPLKRSGPTFHRPQSTTWSTLCEGGCRWCSFIHAEMSSRQSGIHAGSYCWIIWLKWNEELCVISIAIVGKTMCLYNGGPFVLYFGQTSDFSSCKYNKDFWSTFLCNCCEILKFASNLWLKIVPK